ESLRNAQGELERALKGATLTGLRGQLALVERERADVGLTSEDRDRFRELPPRASAEVREDLAAKEAELRLTDKKLKELASQQPAEGDLNQLEDAFASADNKARMDLAQFQEKSGQEYEASLDGLRQLKQKLAGLRIDLQNLGECCRAAELHA